MILTLSRRAEAVLKVRGSRFLGFAIPVESEEEARRMIAGLGDEHSGATHCCYAYRIGRGDKAVERTHDAGRPAGSGGAPILSVIKGRRLGNLLVAVVRYFGGTKLGIGGLARAYRDTAKAAVQAGTLEERELRRRLTVTLPLPMVGEARSQLARLGGELLSESYAAMADLSLVIGESREEELRRTLDDLTRGAARWSGGGE